MSQSPRKKVIPSLCVPLIVLFICRLEKLFLLSQQFRLGQPALIQLIRLLFPRLTRTISYLIPVVLGHSSTYLQRFLVLPS